jgi:diaminobutyrate-2-oxoglutarate transaminase
MSIFQERESEIRAYSRLYPVVFKTSRNALITDESGKDYIDFFAGAGVLNFGHNNPAMKKAVIAHLEADGVTHSLDMETTVKRTFMERFTERVLEPRGMPHKMQFMGPTGTNAVEAAIKLARRVTGRHEIVAFQHGFHGMTLGALALTANQVFRNASGVPLQHARHYPFGCEPVCLGCTRGCGMEGLERLRAQYADTSSGVPAPAAFIVEPIQAEGGVNVASKEWLQGLQKLAKSIGALVILDDIQAGMGRTGSFFSFDGMDLDPDIVCLAKGLGGLGTPIAMNLVKPEHDQHWAPGEHTGTFRGQSLSFVAGTEALDYFKDETTMDEVKKKSAKIFEALAPLGAHPEVQVRGKGMIVGLDLGTGERVKKVALECFDRGVLICPCGTGGRVLKLIPPLTIPEDQLEAGLKIITEVAEEVMKAA